MKKKITDEEFDTALFDYVREEFDDNPANLLLIPGVYEIVAEHLNNEVLEYIEQKSENHGRGGETQLAAVIKAWQQHRRHKPETNEREGR